MDGLAGWPSLVRLTLSAPRGADSQFLWEEIVAGLSPWERAGLLALATLGWGSAGDVRGVAGREVDLEVLVTKVPLLWSDDEGGYGIHHLWEEAVERLFPPHQVDELRERALALLWARGETLRVGSLALRWSAVDWLRRACVALVRESFGALPVDTASRWLAGAPDGARAEPELALLALALRHAAHLDDADLDRDIDDLAARFAALGDADANAVTLALGAVVAHFRGDQLRLFQLAERVRALPAADREPILRFLVGAVKAALAGLAGDVEGALEALASTPFTHVPQSATELVTRLHAAMLVLAGRADEAVVVGERLGRSPSPYVRGIPAMLRWQAGDPSGFAAGRDPLEPDHEINERDLLFQAAYGSAVAASFGDRAAIESVQPLLDKVLAAEPDARDSAIASVAMAYRQIVAHDDRAAVETIAAHLGRFPLTDQLGEIHLRRSPAIAYVCDPTVRRRWDRVALGPSHERSLDVARQLLDGRAGRLSAAAELAPGPIVLTSLPLPWSVELAAWAEAAGCRDGRRLIGELARWSPDAVHDELAWLAGQGDGALHRGAGALVATLPDPAQAPLRIEVLGPLRLRAGDATVDGPELRRGRVRALLSLLVLGGAVRRDRATDLMWPDLDPQAASRNLRVTLSRLRRLVEPDRPPGHPSSWLRLDGTTLALAAPPQVEVDLWELRDHVVGRSSGSWPATPRRPPGTSSGPTPSGGATRWPISRASSSWPATWSRCAARSSTPPSGSASCAWWPGGSTSRSRARSRPGRRRPTSSGPTGWRSRRSSSGATTRAWPSPSPRPSPCSPSSAWSRSRRRRCSSARPAPGWRRGGPSGGSASVDERRGGHPEVGRQPGRGRGRDVVGVAVHEHVAHDHGALGGGAQPVAGRHERRAVCRSHLLLDGEAVVAHGLGSGGDAGRHVAEVRRQASRHVLARRGRVAQDQHRRGERAEHGERGVESLPPGLVGVDAGPGAGLAVAVRRHHDERRAARPRAGPRRWPATPRTRSAPGSPSG